MPMSKYEKCQNMKNVKIEKMSKYDFLLTCHEFECYFE